LRTAGILVATLSADAIFHSPFRTWRSRQVPSVFRARCNAFDNLLVNSVIRDNDQAVILWSETVNGAQSWYRSATALSAALTSSSGPQTR